MINISSYSIAVSIVAMALWSLAAYPFIGLIVVAVYALFVFWKSVESERVFRLGLVSLGITCLATVLQNGLTTNIFSGYTLMLFALGAVVLGKELWDHSVALRDKMQKGGGA